MLWSHEGIPCKYVAIQYKVRFVPDAFLIKYNLRHVKYILCIV